MSDINYDQLELGTYDTNSAGTLEIDDLELLGGLLSRNQDVPVYAETKGERLSVERECPASSCSQEVF